MTTGFERLYVDALPVTGTTTDGSNVTQGSTTDAAVTGDNPGTISAKLRGLVKILTDVWSSGRHTLAVGINDLAGTTIDTNSGNKSAGTQRVVIATDQPALATALPVSVSQQPAYTAPGSGELIGIATATQLPNIACRYVRFKARASNTGTVALGIAAVTMPAGTTTTTAGFELSAGDDTGWIAVDNLNRFFRICSSTAQHLTYMFLV